MKDLIHGNLVGFAIKIACGCMIISVLCVVAFTIKQWQVSDQRLKMENKFNEAKIEALSKPTIIEQRYYSPMNNK